MRDRSHRSTRRATALAALALAAWALPFQGFGQSRPGRQSDASVILPTGQRITPAGTQVVVNSMPMSAELSPDGRYLVVLQAGFETPSLSAIEIESGGIESRVELADAWLGLEFNKAGNRIYVSGGARSSVWELSFREGKLGIEREFSVPAECNGRCNALIGDLRLHSDDRTLYALDVLRDRAVIINTQSGLVLGEFQTGSAPYRARLVPGGGHLVISHWGEASLGLYRLSDQRLVERLPVGEHPTDIVIVPGTVQAPGSGFDGDEERTYPARLFAACSHADNVWTFGIAGPEKLELLDARSVAPLPGSPLGSMPTALGVSPDGTTLYIANSGNNIVLVTDISEALPEPGGAIPTGWFPTATIGLPNGGLAYLSGKGDSQVPGLVSLLPALTSEQLQFLSSAAVANLSGGPAVIEDPPPSASHVGLVMTDTDPAKWQDIFEGAVSLPGFVPPVEGSLGQIAWLTGGMETDFFAKLGPAVTSGRLTERMLRAAGRAARPAAGTLWSNAADASLKVETYGIGGGRPFHALLAKLHAEGEPARLTVVRLLDAEDEQIVSLRELETAWSSHPAYASTALFVVPTGGKPGAVVAGGAVAGESTKQGFVSAPSVLHTIEWLLELRPMTQFDMAAPVLGDLFSANP